MKLLVIYFAVLVGSLGLVAVSSREFTAKPCWCWPGNQHIFAKTKPHVEGTEYRSYGSYDFEVDWNNAERRLPLNYEQAQGKRIFYQNCVWCHADSTPAGPSNRSNVTPDPPLMNDGSLLNGESDASLEKVISLGGSGVGKSPMMPPYGLTLSGDEIKDLVAYIRVIAVPEYRKSPGRVNEISRSRP